MIRRRSCKGPIQIAPTLPYLQRAYDCVKYGEFSPQPYLDVMIPTLLDPAWRRRASMSCRLRRSTRPISCGTATGTSRREAFGDVVIDTLAEYAPKIRDAILHRRVLTPPDLEAAYGLPEGNPSHGEMTLDQFFHMRPIPGYARYRTPIDGLYLCGAGCHPGGGVTGIPGYNAARAILSGEHVRRRDLGVRPWQKARFIEASLARSARALMRRIESERRLIRRYSAPRRSRFSQPGLLPRESPPSRPPSPGSR